MAELKHINIIKSFILLFLVLVVVQVYGVQFNKPSLGDGYAKRPIWSLAKDSDGFVWLATSVNILKFDGYKFESLNLPSEFKYEKQTIHIDFLNRLWIGSEFGDLILYMNNKVIKTYKLTTDSKANLRVYKILSDKNNNIYLATSKGLFFLDALKDKVINIGMLNSNVKDIFINKDNTIYVSSNNKIFYLSVNDGNFNFTEVASFSSDELVTSLLPVNKFEMLIGTTKKLYSLDLTNSLKPKIVGLESKIVLNIQSNDKWIFVGTLLNGLFLIDRKTNLIHNYKNSPNDKQSISDDLIVSLLLDKKGILFIGTFYGNVSILDTNTLNFEQLELAINQTCIKSNTIYSIYVDRDNSLWLSTLNGVVHYSKKTCTRYESNLSINSLSHPEIRSVFTNNNQDYWVSTNSGLNHLSLATQLIDRLEKQVPQIATIFSFNFDDNDMLIGTEKGLFQYNKVTKRSFHFPVENDLLIDAEYTSYIKTDTGDYIFITSVGVAKLDHGKIKLIKEINAKIGTTELTGIHLSKRKNILWISTLNNGLFSFKDFYSLIKHYKRGEDLPLTAQLLDVLEDDNNNLWISSLNGLYRINTLNTDIHIFHENDGLQGDTFKRGGSFRASDGKLYFGGINGIVSFYPSKIKLNKVPPRIALTDFTYFNNVLKYGAKTNSGFKLDKPINYLKEIELGYQDYIIGFEFAALDYADPMRNQYAYRLKGFQQDWVYTDAKNRQATYTNLSSGEYVFQVKGSNKDGVWSTEPKELKIIVHPTPWLSPWAYALYTFFILLSIWGFIRFKTIASRKRAIYLQQKVKERTQEVNQQKKMVELLMEHKNEVFANITHEFKTPLSLILGPADQLSHKLGNQYSKELNMIKRNANRLLLMVKQILKLSQAEHDKNVKKEPQAIQPILLMLYESFKPIADCKSISFHLENEIDVNINATLECLEIIIGNLLSNALKFTNSGGSVSISPKLTNKQIIISVSDSGSGIEQSDIKKIFNRFVRLESHKEIAGTGIGLFVAKEVAQANDGFLEVVSEWGKGSTFKVTLPTTKLKSNIGLSQVIVDQMIMNVSNEMNIVKIKQEDKPKKNRTSVLIIEDNLDMQEHINNVLKHDFYCLFASRGRKGIARALKEVPDVVICDVMMPTMNGYQVTRVLRHDSRTSHIPIIMLTALNTKESRIKGWRENIDTYITKPFDSTELIAQLKNILTIRKLLQDQTNKAIKNNLPLNSIDLPKQDQIFIEKLRDVIAKYYVNEYFQVADIASKMAVSERQLQRKIKALINESPMEVLRDYRLEKSAMMLKDGYQVGIISDSVGFSSVSYYSRCFKKKYGMTPKRYQTLNKKKTF